MIATDARMNGSLVEALRPLLAAHGVVANDVAGFQVGSMAGSGQVKVTVWTATKGQDEHVWQDLRRIEWVEQSAWF
jgi:hypothetical protein